MEGEIEEVREEASEAHEAVAELTAKAIEAEAKSEAAEMIIEEAAEAVKRAQESAQQIAEAAMNTHLGNELAELRKENATWQEKHLLLEAQISELRQTVETMSGRLSALATLEIADQIATQTAQSSSTPPVLADPAATAEAMETVEAVVPAELAESVEDAPAPEPAKRRRQMWM